MNRRPDTPDPLSHEERELAERLLRLGPNDGPSSALDARILAAAHAAVAEPPRLRVRDAQNNKPRWPVWIGVAASLSLAMGIAWQLRPASPQLEAIRAEQDAAVTARAQAEPVADAAAASVASESAAADAMMSAPLPAEPAAESSAAAGAAADRAASDAGLADWSASDVGAPADAPTAAKPTAAGIAPDAAAPPKTDAINETAKRSRADAAPAAQPLATPVVERSLQRQRGWSDTRSAERELKAAPAMAPPPPPAPPAPMPVMSAPLPVDIAAEIAADAPTESAAPPAAAAAPAAMTAAKRASPSAQRSAASPPGSAASQGKAEAYGALAETQAAPAAAGHDAPKLDRVEVTGSRIGSDRQSEAGLSAADWLTRIRDYRDAGQYERARESLQRFRRAHPQARVPDDLRALLK